MRFIEYSSKIFERQWRIKRENNIMDLHLDNLGEIYQLLKKAQQSADITMDQFNAIEKIAPTPEKRQLLDTLLDSMGGYLIEVSHVDAFLQSCDLVEIKRLNPEQHALLIQCQALCQSLKASSRKVLEWSVNMKAISYSIFCETIPAK